MIAAIMEKNYILVMFQTQMYSITIHITLVSQNTHLKIYSINVIILASTGQREIEQNFLL